jgi:hypothetical protein
MQIITSAAYLSGDLKSEFGLIPPSFLPLQNKRLFVHQFLFVQQSSDAVYLTVPQSFIIDDCDADLIKAANVQIIKVPDNLSLSSSILFAINFINKPNEQVLILHGDTLFDHYPIQKNTYYVAYAKDNYNWGNVGLDDNNDSSEVYAGLFYFNNQQVLIDCLNKHANNFITAIEGYAASQKINLQFVDKWMDFGHPNTYFRSKASMTTERVFNNLSIDEFTVNKFSDDALKMQAETNWFITIPPRLKKYTPNFIATHNGNKIGYQLDYLYLNTLAELFVFGQNDPFVWNNIFRSCETFLNDCLPLANENMVANTNKAFTALLLHKTNERLALFAKQIKIDVNKPWVFNAQFMPSLMDIAAETAISITNESIHGYVHGDFCFSNILFDFRKQMIKVIDPRGLDFEKNITTLGDIRYDIAKLSHSVLGMYDYIIAGKFTLTIDNNNSNIVFNLFSNKSVDAIQASFLKKSFVGVAISSKQNFALMIHLFLSMLPLHADNEKRQFAFMANAYRLYQLFKQL